MSTAEFVLPSGHIALVDDDDYQRIIAHAWWINTDGYVWRKRKKHEGNGYLLLHRFLLSVDEQWDVHHKNEDKLDNRKQNLVLVRNSEHGYLHNIRRFPTLPKNCHYKGVHFESSRGKWKAMIHPSGKALFLGRFDTAEEAALAYNHAATLHYGGEAYLNEVPS